MSFTDVQISKPKNYPLVFFCHPRWFLFGLFIAFECAILFFFLITWKGLLGIVGGTLVNIAIASINKQYLKVGMIGFLDKGGLYFLLHPYFSFCKLRRKSKVAKALCIHDEEIAEVFILRDLLTTDGNAGIRSKKRPYLALRLSHTETTLLAQTFTESNNEMPIYLYQPDLLLLDSRFLSPPLHKSMRCLGERYKMGTLQQWEWRYSKDWSTEKLSELVIHLCRLGREKEALPLICHHQDCSRREGKAFIHLAQKNSPACILAVD